MHNRNIHSKRIHFHFHFIGRSGKCSSMFYVTSLESESSSNVQSKIIYLSTNVSRKTMYLSMKLLSVSVDLLYNLKIDSLHSKWPSYYGGIIPVSRSLKFHSSTESSSFNRILSLGSQAAQCWYIKPLSLMRSRLRAQYIVVQQPCLDFKTVHIVYPPRINLECQ